MFLISLPTELQLLIAEQLDPKSCYKLALTCKHSSGLFASLVAQHKIFWLRYNTIVGSERVIWDVTRELIEDPRRVIYVVDINLLTTDEETWEPEYFLGMIPEPHGGIVPEELVQLYIPAVRRHPILRQMLEEKQYPSQAGGGANWSMETTIRKGDTWPIIAILCTISPNLQTLRFTEPPRFGGEFFDMVYRVALAYKDPYYTYPLPFQHLTRVAITHWDTEGCCDSRWALLFIAMPSLRQFAASNMGGTQDAYLGDYEEMPRWFGQSNVQNLLFKHSCFTPDTIYEIIISTKALKSFTYGNGGFMVSEEGRFNPRQVAESLVEHAGHSLERLALYGYDNGVCAKLQFRP
jgi:hypothetical protein